MTKPCDIKAELDAKKSLIAQPHLFCERKAEYQRSEHVILVFGSKFVILPGLWDIQAPFLPSILQSF
jgi:hypothetical protein